MEKNWSGVRSIHVEKLLEKLNEIDFEDLSVDEFLDNRDSKPFDSEWSRVYKEISNLKKETGFTAEQKKYSSEISEKAFMTIYNLSGYGELAEYVSDDFCLIADSKQMNYTDEWLDKLIEKYNNAVIPSGEL